MTRSDRDPITINMMHDRVQDAHIGTLSLGGIAIEQVKAQMNAPPSVPWHGVGAVISRGAFDRDVVKGGVVPGGCDDDEAAIPPGCRTDDIMDDDILDINMM
jgi:hypothetical protein